MIVTAIVTALVTLRRTKGETRWKAKYDAYSRILSAIEDLRFWAEETYASQHMLPTVAPDQLTSAGVRYDDAKRTLWSFVHVGALVVGSAAREKLDALLTQIATEEIRFGDDLGEDDTYSDRLADHCDNLRKIVGDHIQGILTVAKHDLS